MIDLYTAATPNGWKASIALEEVALPYELKALRLDQLDQKQDAFLRINPNGRIPAIVDRDAGDFAVFESGAILLYLAESYGHECQSPAERALAQQWVLFANATLATALFVPSNREREFPRLMEVLDRKLADGPLMGGQWSVADCAVNAYLAYLPIFFPQIDLNPFPQVQATIAATQQRPAYQLVMGQR